MKKWTPAQEQAISSLDGTILVSAAAGSGKTSVLVERIINRISNPVSPTSIDRLLVVTFTRAAATEMKTRLSEALSRLIEKDPSNVSLKRQKLYLPEAQICTMDSFCGKLVRENFEALSVSPDFSMLSDTENKIILNEAAEEVLSDLYENGDENDSRLLELFTNNKNDDTLKNLFIRMYNLAMADFSPQDWIDNAFLPYFEDNTLEKSECGKYVISVLRERICFILEKMDRLLLDVQGSGKLETAVSSDFAAPETELRNLLSAIDSNTSWDNLRQMVAAVSFKNFTRFNNDEKDELYFIVTARRKTIKDEIKNLQGLLFCPSSDYYDDIEYLKPIMTAMKKRVKQFIARVFEVKTEKNAYYFTDILHFALDLLYDKTESGKSVKSAFAKELSEEFDEILIDEFQDTNEAQVSLFNAVSKDGSNEFIVGDVKQSIYAFRQACPEIFVSLLDSVPVFDGKNYPAKIYLDNNFRSRKGVVDTVNFLFDFLMIPRLGGLDYKKTERLRFSAVGFDENDKADAQLHILDGDCGNLVKESQYIGNLIKKMINEKMPVGRGEQKRPVEYGDICILLRAVKDKANIMAGEISKMGIPVHYKKEGGFFDNAEIMTVISMLRVIDNPLSDIPLLSVLLSPMTSFSEDDIALVRAEYSKGTIYSALKLSEEHNEKSKHFLSRLEYFRTLSVTLSVQDLIRRIYETTAFDSVVSAMDDGESRVLNLQKLVSYAEGYTSSGNYNLSGFLRYIDTLQKNGYDLEGAETVSESDNVVRIMTYHKSKGLEFPVVILANTSSKFRDESKERLLVNKTLGAAMYRSVADGTRDVKTQQFISVAAKNAEESTAENLRLLYVAMTRAKEKLIIVGSLKNAEKEITELYYNNNVSDDNLNVAIKNINNFLDWILFAFIRHPSFSALPFVKRLLGRTEEKTESKLNVYLCDSIDEPAELKTFVEYETDLELVEKIKEKVTYTYPYDSLAGIEVKYTASSMDKEHNDEYFASEEPAFMSAGKITPAKKGTLIHRFMELCDMSLASQDLSAEIERLVKNGSFTDDEASVIDKSKLQKFFASSMYERIKNAESFLREKEFTMSVPLKDIKTELNIPNDELAVVQGVIDGFILNGKDGEIIDYKTDRVKSASELCERYKKQMAVYKKAAEQCFKAENVKVTLYSFELSQEISVNFEKNT